MSHYHNICDLPTCNIEFDPPLECNDSTDHLMLCFACAQKESELRQRFMEELE